MSQGVAAPPGYTALTLLDRQRHRERGIAPRVARFAARLHAIYLTLPEFVAASRSNPIVFGRAEDGSWQPLLLTGLEAGRNLCVDAAGDWLPGHYCPAYVRRYPFCTARVRGEGTSLQSAICVDEAGLAPTPPHLFDARGEPTPRWQELQRFIEEVDLATRQTEAFCAAVAELGLLDPFDADINPVRGRRKRVTGMWCVVESRLAALDAAALARLMQQGFLSRVYAHLMSLDNFQRLLEADVARSGTA
ncbi:MAG TPA: SapC family protein [Gammaproteobacteria bacterium]|nr:SapC family protein [Gammaproteobacteria bacterium]